MDLGIDLGTSGVKALLLGTDGAVVAEATAPLEVSRPRPGWSEQDPARWWDATRAALARLREAAPAAFGSVRALGLSGQMHGAVLLDASDRVLRPALLWNDGRSSAECAELERREPRTRALTGNRAMPGFTAPKLIWVARHEPEVFARTARVLLPKDWLRLVLTGEAVSEPSDAAGTLWLDVARRVWSEPMLEACRLPLLAMPALVEGNAPSGALRSEVAQALGLRAGLPVAGGAGDNAAGAVGVGVVRPGQAFLSLGTSGVTFVANERFAPDPDGGVHAFCHCLPRTWHQMAVTLSAASCLAWACRATGAASEAALLAEVEAGSADPHVLFLPYLSGERTPHDDPHARGVFFGLSHDTARADLGRAVLEGVAFAFADGEAALRAAGARIDELYVIGGGARSTLWCRILASLLGRTLRRPDDAALGPALGAARLARLAATGEAPEAVCTPPASAEEIAPEPAIADALAGRYRRWRALYPALRAAFADAAGAARGD